MDDVMFTNINTSDEPEQTVYGPVDINFEDIGSDPETNKPIVAIRNIPVETVFGDKPTLIKSGDGIMLCNERFTFIATVDNVLEFIINRKNNSIVVLKFTYKIANSVLDDHNRAQTILPDVVIGKMFTYDKYLTVQLYGNIDHILSNQDEFERVILGQFTACSYNGTMYHLVKTGNDNTPKSYSIMTIRHLLELDGENEYVTTSMIIILTSSAMHSDAKIKAIRQIISQGVI